MSEQPTNSTFTGVDDVLYQTLRDIAAQPDQWREARMNPRSFLQRHHGLELPPDISIELYDIARDTAAVPLYGAELDNVSSTGTAVAPTLQAVRPLPDDVIQLLIERNMGCPLGTLPYKTVRGVQKCIKYGIMKGGLEWVPAEEGSPLGHFEYKDIKKICLQSVTTFEEVIECLPFLQQL